jgi:hypothetical protein
VDPSSDCHPASPRQRHPPVNGRKGFATFGHKSINGVSSPTDRSAENRDARERVQTVRENDAVDGLRLQIQRPITTDFTWARGRGPQVGNEERHRFHTGPSAALWVKSQVDAPPC